MSYPAPILNLPFGISRQLCHPAVTISRGSIAPYWQSSPNALGGKLAYARAGVPRFGCDPVTGVCNGLLSELPATYIDPFSSQFDNASFTKGNASITSNVVMSLEGRTAGDKLVEDTTANDVHYIGRGVSATLNTSFGAMWVVSAGERSTLMLKITDNAATSNYFQATFDLSAVTASAVTVAGNATSGKVGIISLGGGRYLVWISGITNSATGSGTAFVQLRMMSGGSYLYTGDGSSGLYLHYESSGQWEYPPSLMPTGWETTSTTSNDIATGTHTFTVDDSATTAGRAIPTGATVRIWQTSNTANYMTGTVTSHSDTTLVVSITAVGGSGTGVTSWTIQAGASVTRAADVCQCELTQLVNMTGESLWTGTEGAFAIRATTARGAAISGKSQVLFSISSGGSWNEAFFFQRSSSGAMAFVIRHNNVQYPIWSSPVQNSTEINVVGVFNASNFVFYMNGVYIGTIAIQLPTNISTLRIGSDVSSAQQWDGPIRSFQLYNRRIDDAYLPALSTL